MLAKIKLSESRPLSFSFKVEDNEEPVSGIYLVVEGAEYDVRIKGSLDNGTLSFKVPALESAVKGGVLPCSVEVYIGESRFVPVKDTIEFIASVKIEAISKPVEIPNKTVTKFKLDLNESFNSGDSIVFKGEKGSVTKVLNENSYMIKTNSGTFQVSKTEITKQHE
jgi:hypothetical protein